MKTIRVSEQEANQIKLKRDEAKKRKTKTLNFIKTLKIASEYLKFLHRKKFHPSYSNFTNSFKYFEHDSAEMYEQIIFVFKLNDSEVNK